MIDGVLTQYPVSHHFERAAHVRQVMDGTLPREEACDADFLLRAAAEHHGVEAGRKCPLCGSQLRDTLWVYGEDLGRRAGSARSAKEIAEFAEELATAGKVFTVHRVEVCLTCRWNHLLETATVYGATSTAC